MHRIVEAQVYVMLYQLLNVDFFIATLYITKHTFHSTLIQGVGQSKGVLSWMCMYIIR